MSGVLVLCCVCGGECALHFLSRICGYSVRAFLYCHWFVSMRAGFDGMFVSMSDTMMRVCVHNGYWPVFILLFLLFLLLYIVFHGDFVVKVLCT